jgi:hypothetical protein
VPQRRASHIQICQRRFTYLSYTPTRPCILGRCRRGPGLIRSFSLTSVAQGTPSPCILAAGPASAEGKSRAQRVLIATRKLLDQKSASAPPPERQV